MGPVAYDAHLKGPLHLMVNYSEPIDVSIFLKNFNKTYGKFRTQY